MSTKLLNWAGNHTYSTVRLAQAHSIEEVQTLVAESERLHVLGARHSFSSVADSDGTLISLAAMNRVLDIDSDSQTVTVEAGISYSELCPVLYEAGFSLHNLASLPHITVAGATATATHGSGNLNRNLSASVVGLDVITANGDLVHFSPAQDADAFAGAVVHLGGLGVVVALKLALEPRYDVCQEVFVQLPHTELDANFDAIMGAAYSVSLFDNWLDDAVNQVWLKQRVHDPDDFARKTDFFSATAAQVPTHPIAGMTSESLTEQLGRPGAWYDRLPHFRIGQVPSAGEEIQSEYFVAREDSVAAIQALRPLGSQFSPVLMCTEIRTVAADELWLSSAYKQDITGIHFTWKRDWPVVRQLLPLIEARLAPFTPRPHWGKTFALSPAQVQAQFPRLSDFRQLMREYDPTGKFRNAFLETYLSS